VRWSDGKACKPDQQSHVVTLLDSHIFFILTEQFSAVGAVPAERMDWMIK